MAFCSSGGVILDRFARAVVLDRVTEVVALEGSTGAVVPDYVTGIVVLEGLTSPSGGILTRKTCCSVQGKNSGMSWEVSLI